MKNNPQSTNKIILDYLLYLSIQSRLKQATVELLELSTPLPKDDDTFKLRKQRWQDTAIKAEQDKKAVEAIIAGILSSHCNRTPGFKIDSNFEQRLHLCQLTNLVFGRFDTLSVKIHSVSSERRRKRHEDIIDDPNCDIKRRQVMFSSNILPPFCRRHRIQNCYGCHPNKPLHPPAGLIEAIPTFLRTSADLLRRTLDNQIDDGKPMMFAGQKVMGGGMPPQWYDLFLELLTQAAIESYLCDSQTGLESIFEIFSYGDVEDEEYESDDEDSDDEDDDEEHVDEWGIRAEDHHLLFPKTRTMHLFKTQVREREKDFLQVEKGTTLQQHFEKLAQRFPLKQFEKSMGEFIQMILDSMDTPTLDKYEQSIDKQSKTSSGPTLYKYPSDGSLLMPEIPDEDERPITTKRSASDSIEDKPYTKKLKQ